MDFAYLRRLMVSRQLRARGIHDQRVLDAMGAIPREEFVPEEYRGSAYADEPIGIGYGQTISQPYMTALMAQCLELSATDTVLEVGGGSGYHAAVLGAIARSVVTVELIPELAEFARANLERAGRAGNVAVIAGDGSRGYRDLAPFDAVSVAAAGPMIPAKLLDQLKDPGILVMPVGGSWDQELRVLRKFGGEVAWRVAAYCRFVPLREPVPHSMN